MPVKMACPHCRAAFSVPDGVVGKKVRCKRCSQVFVAEKPAGPPAGEVVRAGTPPPQAGPRVRRAGDEAPEPVRRKPGSFPLAPLLLALGGVAVLGVLLVAGLGAAFFLRARPAANDLRRAGPVGGPLPAPGFDDSPPANLDEALAALRGDPLRRAAGMRWLASAPADPARQDEVARALDPLLRETAHFPDSTALLAAATWATRENVPALVEVLESPQAGPSDDRQLRAARILLKFRDERAAPGFAHQLAGPAEVADLAEQGLRDLGPAAEKALLRHLNDPDESARRRAAGLLNALGTPQPALVRQTLTDLLADDDRRLRAALHWLTRAKPDDALRPEVVKALDAALDRTLARPDGLAGSVAEALLAWGGAESIPVLIRVLDKGRFVHEPVGEAVFARLCESRDPRTAVLLMMRVN